VKLENEIKLHNKFDVKVLDLSGNIKLEQVVYNVVLDNIYTRLLDWMPFFQGIAFGTGAGVPAGTDTGLFTHLDWKNFSQLGCGTIEETSNFPIFSRKRRITIYEDEHIGKTITEVGVAYSDDTDTSGDGSITYSGLVTHAMLNIPIVKTNLDVIQIDATMYLDFTSYLMSKYSNNVYWMYNNTLTDYFFGGDIPSCYFYLSDGRYKDNVVNSNQLGKSAAIARTDWIKDAANKKVSTPVIRFGTYEGNGDVRGIGFGSSTTKGIFGSVFPVTDVFTEYQITGEELGTGDGETVNFDFAHDGIIAETAIVYIDDVAQAAGFTIEENIYNDVYWKKSGIDAPAGAVNGIAFSPDKTYMAVAHDASPYITIYKQEGNTFNKLDALPELDGAGQSIEFSINGTYLAVTHSGSPYITIYKRSGDNFTKLSNIDELPGNGYGINFSDDGTYIAAVHDVSPYITVYKKDKGSFTKLSALTALDGIGNAVSFSADGTYLAAAHETSPYITVYKRTNDNFTKLPALTALDGAGNGIVFSADGTYLAAAHDTSPYITVYKREADVFTKLPTLPPLSGNGNEVSFSADGIYLAAAHETSPYITIYKRENDAFTKLSELAALPGAGRGVTFSPSSTYLAVGHEGSQFITIYEVNTNTPSQNHNIVFSTPPGLVTGEAVGTGDGLIQAFALDNTPDAESLTVYINSVATSDFTISDNTITFNTAPAAGDVITADYKYSCTVTADYKIPFIPKDENRVLDVQCSITWNAV